MELTRELTMQETKLLEILLEKASLSFTWKEKLKVSNMDDGGMGGLFLFPNGKREHNTKFGKLVSELQFLDVDNTPVIASLYLDENDEPFELDIWKTNFEKLISLDIDLSSLDDNVNL
jgi:hypothetical protein